MGITYLPDKSNFNNLQPKFATHTTTKVDTEYDTVVSVLGAGYLTGIYQYVLNSDYFARYGLIKITIDGTIVLDWTNFSVFAQGNSNALSTGGSLSCLHRFKTSLLVEHKGSSGGGTTTTTTIVSYIQE